MVLMASRCWRRGDEEARCRPGRDGHAIAGGLLVIGCSPVLLVDSHPGPDVWLVRWRGVAGVGVRHAGAGQERVPRAWPWVRLSVAQGIHRSDVVVWRCGGPQHAGPGSGSHRTSGQTRRGPRAWDTDRAVPRRLPGLRHREHRADAGTLNPSTPCRSVRLESGRGPAECARGRTHSLPAPSTRPRHLEGLWPIRGCRSAHIQSKRPHHPRRGPSPDGRGAVVGAPVVRG